MIIWDFDGTLFARNFRCGHARQQTIEGPTILVAIFQMDLNGNSTVLDRKRNNVFDIDLPRWNTIFHPRAAAAPIA